jgi:GT2 family glycosyltransferase
VNERVHVLLPAHNRRGVTEKCVACLRAQTWDNVHLVFIDDGSTDGTAEMVLRYFPEATVLRGTGDWWWAGSLQQGFDQLKRSGAGSDDIILILNDDTTFEPGFIEAAVKALRDCKRSLLLAQLYSIETGQLVETGVHVDWRNFSFRGVIEPEAINCFSTRGLFLRVGDMLAIGGFHTVLLPHYASDYEYTMRAHRKGFALITAPGVRLWMTEGTTGVREFEKQTLRGFLRTVFSKRTVHNPVYWTSFVLLSSPARHVPANLWRVWRTFFLHAFEWIG